MRVEHVVVRKKQEKVHFLRGTKNDGKASLRGYMHTNWPQQRGSLSQTRRGWKKPIENFFFSKPKPARPLVLAVTKPFVVILALPQHFLWGTPYADWRTSENRAIWSFNCNLLPNGVVNVYVVHRSQFKCVWQGIKTIGKWPWLGLLVTIIPLTISVHFQSCFAV